MRERVISQILEGKLIAIVRGMEEEKILPIAEAIRAGGIAMLEVTFNQAKPESFAATARAIRSVRKAYGDQGFAGAGTVLTEEQLLLAAEAGAQYIISPDTNPAIIRKTRELGLVSIPGAMTASECVSAHNAGADFVKIFPLGNLGPGYLKAIRAPLSHIRFLGVGGISEKNIGEYLAVGAAGFGVGGNLVNKEWIDTGRFDLITELAAKYTAAVR
ncbi:MAG: bifunctional 4-hydroxy-2-oxoglutarate aldolase/2-dehydro-3-deoxy-phosphogluconate aldolase [Clostridiales bacterium]|jgi:2-dehydro-3-deoxyphosphogluconate aldolase/(4S)-4-hydroxy-2-oxoglutarate aldolase|nr:bifunctional 4-hydroxy-2-oxoglutarate aldolase/2-dehydro-3-deoxy-phosphogluconate aldolase [Clostridiales bacterium]